MLAGKNVQELCTLLFPICSFCQDMQVHWSHPKNTPVGLFLPPAVGFGSLRDQCFVFFQEKERNSAAVSDT
jgi:hypothetical protein